MDLESGIFLKENKYTGYGEGFLNLKKLYEKGSPIIVGELQKDKSLSETELKNCMAVASDHINNVPEIVFGTKALGSKYLVPMRTLVNLLVAVV